MHPAIEPFQSGYLPVSDNNEIYWETSGNPKGKPVLYLHGGPGGGLSSGYRKLFDPEKYLIISFEQRGCGRSRPKAFEDISKLSTNTTQALIADMEALRLYLKVESWLLYGVSWGTTLSLAYAQAYPKNVTALILMAVCTTTAKEVEWITEGMGQFFPPEWKKFCAAAKPLPGERIIDAYYQKIISPDRNVREAAAKAWCAWEDIHISFDPKSAPYPKFQDAEFRLQFATLVIHYWKHAAFMNEKSILSQMNRIAHIPGVLIHGRLDISAPVETAWQLNQAWPNSELIIVHHEGHGGEKMIQEVSRAIAKIGLS